jgi:flagellar P-ring protein precursor FlgI
MRKELKRILPVGLLVPALVCSAWGKPRIKDIGKVGLRGEVQLVGYGLVVGLDGTGDSKGTEFTVQSVVNMLERMGVSVPANKVRIKNVAAVMLSAHLPTTARVGARLDVTVSSLGDAKSLEGGTLLMSPLRDRHGEVYAYAQGAVSVGGFKAGGAGGDQISQNYTLVGRIPGGATVETEPTGGAWIYDHVDIALFNPDYTTASRISEAVSRELDGVRAEPVDPGLVRVSVPDSIISSGAVVDFIARLEGARVQPDAAAVVVINEKTGTIVAGENVTIGAVAIAHGSLSIQISSRPIIAQPAPFGQGETVVVPDTHVEVDNPESRVVTMEESADVADVARALNTLGVNPRDIIAIFQALSEAGALRAEVRII